MGVILSMFHLGQQPYERPRKIELATIYGVEITLAHLSNVLLSIVVIILTVLLEYGTIPAVQQGFFCGDPLISHKYQGDTVTPEILGVTAFCVPLIIITITEVLAHQSFRKINLYAILFYMQECVVGTALTLLLTSIAKVIVGEPRPHFFDTCEPDTARNCTVGTFIGHYTCTSTKFSYIFLVDSSLSFPSGHASISWFIGIFLCFLIHIRTTTINAGYIMRPFLISLVLSWSILCSLSRITDRRHHWWDVLAGTVFGICSALYSVLVLYEKMKKNDILLNNDTFSNDVPLSQIRKT